MSGVFAGDLPSHLETGFAKSILCSREGFALDHATESMRFFDFRKAAEWKFTGIYTEGIKKKKYPDIYGYELPVPDLRLTPNLWQDVYFLSKGFVNLQVKAAYRNIGAQYLKFSPDTRLASVSWKVLVDNANSQMDVIFNSGFYPDELKTMLNDASNSFNGGTGGTGAIMNGSSRVRADRRIAGIKYFKIGGISVGILTKENCKFEATCEAPADRETAQLLKFPDGITIATLIEMMQTSLKDEVWRAIDVADGEPDMELGFASGFKAIWEEGTGSITPMEIVGGDGAKHMSLAIDYGIDYNSDEDTPDNIVFDNTGAGSVTFKNPDTV